MIKKLLKNKKVRIGMVCGFILIIGIILAIIIVKKNQKDPITNFNFELLDATFLDGTSSFEFEITNTSKKKRRLNEFKVYVKDNYDLVLVALSGVVDTEIKPNESITTTISYGGDLSDYKSFEYGIESNKK